MILGAYQYISQQLLSGTVFQHVIVDEYQDTNTIQKKIYMQLASGNKNICVVGDDDQALYRFRGATVENLVDFENICEKEFENAFEDAGIPYYAPRANNILNTEEFLVVFGILAKIFKVEANPDGARGEGMKNFQKWLQAALVRADEVVLYNFGLITKYLAKYMEMNNPIISGKNFHIRIVLEITWYSINMSLCHQEVRLCSLVVLYTRVLKTCRTL